MVSMVLVCLVLKVLSDQPIILCPLAAMVEICRSNLRLSWMVMPRSLTCVICVIGVPFGVEYDATLSPLPNVIASNFDWLNFMLIEFAHSYTVFRSSCISIAAWMPEIADHRRESSAKEPTEDLFTRESILFIMTRKSVGPRTEPWGTPDSTLTGVDKLLSTLTRWDRDFRKLDNQDRRGSWMLSPLSSRRRMSWSTIGRRSNHDCIIETYFKEGIGVYCSEGSLIQG